MAVEVEEDMLIMEKMEQLLLLLHFLNCIIFIIKIIKNDFIIFIIIFKDA